MLVPANYSETMEFQGSAFDHQLFKIIQFYSHPNEAEKTALKNSGVELIAYLPNYAWLASFDENFAIQKLRNYNVRAILEVPLEYKLSRSLQLEEYPSHIQVGENLKVWVTFYPTVKLEKIQSDLSQKGYEIIEYNEISSAKEMVVPISRIEELANLPYVQFIEPISPEPNLEGGFVEDRNNHRANYLASEQLGGLHFDGSGITLAVREGGTVDPSIHNDFKGRLDYSLDAGAAASSHKTGVAWRMAGYGNDNPSNTGMAFGSNVISTTGGFSYLVNNTNAIAVNNSYGFGCYIGTYGSSGRSNDDLIYNNPSFMIAYSAGNIQTTDCGYGAGASWGTITGDSKQAKNVLAVGALNTNDELMGFSSWGPAPDGRIKPDICAVGPGGTSFACPNVVGGFGQLYHAYFDLNGVLPNSGLIKGILQNTADDLGNPGPDFKYGYGRINLRRAYETIANNTIIADNISSGAVDNHILNIPVGTKQVRVMLYWMDYEGTVGSSVALVNNLNLTVTAPNSTVYNPWVLDHTINATNLNANATRGVDALNNMEQVTIDNPTAGSYSITVTGFSVPQGPQSYFVVYEFLEDELTLTYPIGGESMVAGETQRIYWDSYGNTTGTFDLSYSTDNGYTWIPIASGLANGSRFYDWTVPSIISGKLKIRVERGSLADQSSEGFSIIGVPTNVVLIWSCSDSLKLGWDAVPGATAYEVFKLGTEYMTSVGTSSGTNKTIYGVSTNSNEYFAVRALGTNNAKGRRTNSLKKTPGDENCVPLEVSATAIASHPSGYYPDCYTPFGNNVRFQFLNNGVSSLSSLSVSYQLNSGSIQTETFNGLVASGAYGEHLFSSGISILSAGNYSLKAWVNSMDANATNDTAISRITIYSGGTATYPYSQTFDAFTNCATTWDCTGYSCTLEENWFNVPFDYEKGDSTEWRTFSGATGTGGTGPSFDHTSGSGKYLYMETSGNSGSGCQFDDAYALTPCIDLSSATKPELSFWYHAYGSSIGELHVDIFVDGEWIYDLTPPIQGDKGNTWFQQTANLIPYVGKTVILRFRGSNGGGFTGDLAIDDVGIQENPALVDPNPLPCYPPQDVSASVTSGTTGLITWNAGGSETMWDVHIVPSGAAAPIGLGTVVTDTFYLASGLAALNIYDIYVRAICGGGDTSYNSNTSLSIYCASGSASSIDSKIGMVAMDGDSVVSGANCASYTDLRGTPLFNLQFGTSSSISVEYASCGGTYNAYSQVYIDFNNDLDFDDANEIVASGLVNSTTNLNSPITMPVYGYTGDYTMRVVLMEGGSATSTMPCGTYSWGETQDYTVHILSLSPPSSCAFPSNLGSVATSESSALVYWIAGDTLASNWVVQYRTNGGMSSSAIATNDTLTLTSLEHSTLYQVSVGEICASGDTSWMVGPAQFQTWFAPDYLEDFNSGFSWSEGNGRITDSTTFTGASSNWIDGAFNNDFVTNDLAASMNIFSTGRYEWMFSPTIVVQDNGSVYELSFDMGMTEWNSSTLEAIMGVDDTVMVVVSTDNGVTWSRSNVVYMVHQGNKPAAVLSWPVSIPLFGYSGNLKIGFYAEGTVSNEDIDVFIDNVAITENCSLAPMSISGVNFVSSPAQYNVQYSISGGDLFLLQTREVGTDTWFTPKSWTNTSLTNQNFLAKRPGVDNEVRLGARVDGNFYYSCPMTFSADCKPMTVNAIELIDPFCAGDSAQLKAIANGGFKAKTFLWNTGETTRFIYGQQGQTYQVVVTDAAGCSDSASVSVSTVGSPYTPGNFTLAKPNQVTFVGSWTAPSLGMGVSLIGYRMQYRQVNVGAPWRQTSLITSGTSATVNFTGSCDPSANYEFAVFARVNDNGMIYNTPVTCTERRFYNGSGGCAKTAEAGNGLNLSGNGITVYPNPTQGIVNVSLNNEAASLELLDMNGKLLFSQEFEGLAEANINLTNLASGVYMLNVTTDTCVYQERVVKN